MSDEKAKIPIAARVIVLRFDGRGEPWPVASIEIDAAGKRVFAGDAGKAYEPLVAAARKCGARLMDQGLREALLERAGLRDDLDPLAADGGRTGVSALPALVPVEAPELTGVSALPVPLPAAGDGF